MSFSDCPKCGLPIGRQQERCQVCAEANPATAFTAYHLPGHAFLTAISVQRIEGASPITTIGERAWWRIESALASTNAGVDGEHRRLQITGNVRYPESEAFEPTDLAVACALLIDAGTLDPVLARCGLYYARLAHDGTLIPAPLGIEHVAYLALRLGRTNLHVADLDEPRLSRIAGLRLWGYDRLGDLVKAWSRPRQTGLDPDAESGNPAREGL
jgi:hypothetical protein